MRLLHFLEYDISEGLIRFWRRYLWLIVLVFITCLLLDRASGDYLGMYGESWSPLGYIVNAFWGRDHFILTRIHRISSDFHWRGFCSIFCLHTVLEIMWKRICMVLVCSLC